MSSGMQDLNFVESITERDIDFLLLEELQVSTEFHDWLSSRVFGRPIFKSHIGAWHSVVDPVLGESDLIFIFKSEDETTTAILIENKINAEAQPDQGRRYTERGEKGKADGSWQEYQTCLIAPRKYLASPAQTEAYDCQIPYEEVVSYFTARRSVDARHNHRAIMVLEAVKQQRRGYQAKTDNLMTEFVSEYWKYVQANHQSLGMPEPKPRPAGSTWINFFPTGFPKTIDVVHQLTAGYIKVFFKGRAPEFQSIEARYKDMASLFPGLEVALAGKSVAISIPVDSVKPLETTFAAGKYGVASALDVVERLVQELGIRGLQ
jgi:hypothetical protein